MFTWFLKEIPKEKHILSIQKNSLKSSLDISHPQVLLLHSGFRKSCALSLLPSRLPEDQPPPSLSPTQCLYSQVALLVCSVTRYFPGKHDLPPVLQVFSLTFQEGGSRSLGEYNPPPCYTCTNSSSPQQPLSGRAGILAQRLSDFSQMLSKMAVME